MHPGKVSLATLKHTYGLRLLHLPDPLLVGSLKVFMMLYMSPTFERLS